MVAVAEVVTQRWEETVSLLVAVGVMAASEDEAVMAVVLRYLVMVMLRAVTVEALVVLASGIPRRDLGTRT